MILLATTLTLATLLAALAAPATTRADAGSLRVVSYNLRNPSGAPPIDWPTRRPAMKQLLHALAADVIGTQEGRAAQLAEIDADLGDAYARVGIGRDADGGGEHSAIYYRTARLKLETHGDFWISPTPETPGSMGWGARLPRLVSWATFTDLQTGRSIAVFNTHFDHESAEARRRGAELLRDRAAVHAAKTPTIITGDFNASDDGSEPYRLLTAGGTFRDTRRLAPDAAGTTIASFNDFGAPRPGPAIDWILVSEHFDARSWRIDPFTRDGRPPSDHFPVIADLVYR
jgi:endonuclease/exonuclease/phosphatase family metal-dependent hydrolase